LITGGMGGLGLAIAHWLREHGARHLVLLSRSGANTEQRKAAIAALQQSDIEVLAPTVDVTDRVAMTALFEQISQTLPPLRGIIHAAGLGGFTYIPDLCAADLETLLDPKVAGTWNLHELSLGCDLDFFVSFSSIASVWGSVGQAHYAAANQFLDLFAAYRRQLGLAALTINWSAVTGAGMLTAAKAAEMEQYLSRIGVGRLSLSEVTTALELLLATGTDQAVVAPMDWSRFRSVYETGRRRHLLDCLGQPTPLSETEIQVEKTVLRAQIEAAPSAERFKLLRRSIQAEVGAVLGLPATNLPAIDAGFLSWEWIP
ncbi:MAG: SDR family NAD(P)-dependent oxidoreductase, partial [Leptolyngbyaceae cyanobacterium CRU_2_3]|nr:SDR family NAD(P)-dependent oxidoreductase [Leptolyngbyaceae cyanobacterium CRU_2_3]